MHDPLQQQDILKSLELKVDFKPPEVCKLLTSDQFSKRIFLVDVNVNEKDLNELKIELDVIFNPLPISRGYGEKHYYRVGSTYAKIEIFTPKTFVKKATRNLEIDVIYKNENTEQNKSVMEFSPKLKSGPLEADIGVIGGENTLSNSTNSSFNWREYVVAGVHLTRGYSWELSLPRGEKVIRDYILGNLPLFIECGWDQETEAAKILGVIVKFYYNVQIFDSEGKAIKKKKSLVIAYLLWRKGLLLYKSFQEISISISKGSVVS